MKIVISNPKDGKSYKVELPDEKSFPLIGKKVGEEFDGGVFGLSGYKLKLTGGSDKDGFPMRSDVQGSVRPKIMIPKGVGFRGKEEGKQKKRVHGNTVDAKIMQLNVAVSTPGAKTLEEYFPKAEEAKKE